MMKPTISLCMIVRDEEHNLAECLQGVRGLVDQMVIVDTGSTDGTRDVAKRFGAEVHEFPWVDDFSAARNESRRHATGDWIFWLDADDRIDQENRRKLKSLFDGLGRFDPARKPVCLMSVVFRIPGQESDTRMGQARLFIGTAGIRWRGAVHEHLVDETGRADALQLVPTDITIRHEGYSDLEQYCRKRQRNLRLLERAYLLDPDEPLTPYYLGELYVQLGDRALALKYLRRSIRNDPRSESLSTRLAYTWACECLIQEGRLDEGMRLCQEGLSRFPGHPELQYLWGRQLLATGQLQQAERWLRRLLADSGDGLSLTAAAADLRQRQAPLLLAEALTRQGRWDEAGKVYQQIAAARPECVEAWLGLGQAAFVLRQRDVLELAASRLEGCRGGAVPASLLRAQACITQSRWAEGRRWIDRALALSPRNLQAFLVLSDLLFQEGSDLPACIEVHERVLQADPSQVEVRRRLEMLRAQERGPAAVTPGTLSGAAVGSGGLMFSA